MLCRPRHPFLKLAIESLPEFKSQNNVVHRTGPRYLTAILERYQAADSNRSDKCAKDPTSRDDCIFIAPSKIFESLDLWNAHRYKDFCRNKLRDAKPDVFARDNVLRHCRDYVTGIDQLGSTTEMANNSERLAVHHYLHLGYRPDSIGDTPIDLNNFIRGYWMYKTKKGLTYVHNGLD